MENPKQLMPKTCAASPTQPPTVAGGKAHEQLSSELIRNVNKVFTTLKVTYPAWYEKYFGDQKSEQLAKRVWMTGIKTLTTKQVDTGLQKMVIESDYPPKLKDFIALCTRLDELPTLDIAWHEALQGIYSHQVVKVAAKLTGINELRQASYDNFLLKKRFEYYLAQVINKFRKGEELTHVVTALEQRPLLEKVEQQAEQRVMERIKAQGITLTNARAKCLAMLGIKRP